MPSFSTSLQLQLTATAQLRLWPTARGSGCQSARAHDRRPMPRPPWSYGIDRMMCGPSHVVTGTGSRFQTSIAAWNFGFDGL